MTTSIEVRLPPKAAAIVGRDSLTLEAQADHSILFTVYHTGQWEPHVMDLIAERLPVGGTFIDVGANIGIHAVLGAYRVGPSGQVLAIEPSPVTYPVLAENLAATGCPGAVAHNVGVWHTPATLTFSHIPENPAHSHLSATGHHDGELFQVACEPLDHLVAAAGLARVDMIKLDVEGSEIQALQGADSILRAHKPVLLVELNEGTLHDHMNSTGLALYDCIRQYGYDIFIAAPDSRRIPAPTFAAVEEFWAEGCPVVDLLCVTKG